MNTFKVTLEDSVESKNRDRKMYSLSKMEKREREKESKGRESDVRGQARESMCVWVGGWGYRKA